MSEIVAVAFGESESQVWGVSWRGDPGSTARLAIARGPATYLLDGALEAGAGDGAWRWGGAGLSLEFAPTGPPAPGGTTDELQTLDDLCSVTGAVELDGASFDLQCLGWRTSAHAQADLEKIGSVRWLAAWLGPRDGFSLIALRPRKARGQDADSIAAALIDDPPAPPIDEPRLSTTYSGEGVPSRVGLELWLEAEPEAVENADGVENSDAPPQYPRRAAGEVIAPGPAWDEDGFELRASLVRWRSHGGVGPGVYLLGQRR